MVTSVSGKTFQKLEIKKFQMCLKLHHLFQISYKIDTVSPDFPFHNICISAREKYKTQSTYETLLIYEPKISQDRIISILKGWKEED